MTIWRVVYRGRAGRADEMVDADECHRSHGHMTLVRWDVVVMWPREVVVRRLRAADVERVERVD